MKKKGVLTTSLIVQVEKYINIDITEDGVYKQKKHMSNSQNLDVCEQLVSYD